MNAWTLKQTHIVKVVEHSNTSGRRIQAIDYAED